jgi:hypothetical protein
MKSSESILIVFLTFIIVTSCSPTRILGIYSDRFSEKIELKADSTFIHSYRFDLGSSWTTGKWKMKNDTIYLKTKLIMDTLQIRNSENKIIRDSLVISGNQKAERVESNDLIALVLSSGGQNKVKPPEKLFVRGNKLYLINESGKLDLRKLKAFSSNRKYNTYFRKRN